MKNLKTVIAIAASVNMLLWWIGGFVSIGYGIKGIVTDNFKWSVIIAGIAIPFGMSLILLTVGKIMGKRLLRKTIEEVKSKPDTPSKWAQRLAEMQERQRNKH